MYKVMKYNDRSYGKMYILPGSRRYFQISHGIHFVQMEVGDEISKRNEVGVLVRAKESERELVH